MDGRDGPEKWAASKCGCMNRRRPWWTAPARKLLKKKCKQCHETERIVLLRFDRTKWETTVDRMREYITDLGMQEVSDQEEAAVVSYLTKNYSGAPGMANARPDENSRLPQMLLSRAQPPTTWPSISSCRGIRSATRTTDHRSSRQRLGRRAQRLLHRQVRSEDFYLHGNRAAPRQSQNRAFPAPSARMATGSGFRTSATIAAG